MAKRKAGRPSSYDRAIADAICERIADGQPLRQICRDEMMPPWRTVYNWLQDNEDFSARFARAREIGFDAIAQECLDIADESAFDAIEGENGVLRANTEFIQRSKLRVETRLKLLAKWDPKRYGEKVQQELSGPDGGPLKQSIEVSFVPSKS